MQVLTQFQKLEKWRQSGRVSLEALSELDDKAPWEGGGACKVCGIDDDDANVLLCDKCNAEYHQYCLDPPLAKIPEENWYCPSCVVGTSTTQSASGTRSQFLHYREYQGEIGSHFEFIAHLASDMEEREYWELELYQVCLPVTSSIQIYIRFLVIPNNKSVDLHFQ